MCHASKLNDQPSVQLKQLNLYQNGPTKKRPAVIFLQGLNKEQQLEKYSLWKSTDYTRNKHPQVRDDRSLITPRRTTSQIFDACLWIKIQIQPVTSKQCAPGPYTSQRVFAGGVALRTSNTHCCAPFGLRSELELKVRFFLLLLWLYLWETVISAAYCKEQSPGETKPKQD